MNNIEQPAMNGGSWAGDVSIYNKENMLNTFSWNKEKEPSKGEHVFKDRMLENLKYNIIPLISQNEETVFNFFMVPYSIAYWYLEECNGNLEAHFYNVKMVLSEILKYNNVKVYFFQDDKDIILNLDNYKDYTHFSPEINSFMMKEILKNNYEITLENYEGILDDFYTYLKTFDYVSFFNEQQKN